jgi:cell fate (sporulation/competence/biofilm development) regulator YlbF (YheA/YmcA/DUF963 family)
VALEALKAEIGLLLESMTNQAHDRFELYEQIKEKLNDMRAFGMPPPRDLLDLEAELDREFTEENRASRASKPR